MRIGHGEGPPGPEEHRQVVGHVTEGPHLPRVDPELRAPAGERGSLGDPLRRDLGQPAGTAEGHDRAVADDLGDRGDELVVGQVRVAGEQLADERVVQPLDGRGRHEVLRVVVDRGKHALRGQPRVPLGGETRAGQLVAQVEHDLGDDLARDGAHAEDPPLGDVVAEGTVAADRNSARADDVRQLVEPARGAGGDEDRLEPCIGDGTKGVDRAGRDGPVTAQQGAVEIGGDEPRGHVGYLGAVLGWLLRRAGSSSRGCPRRRRTGCRAGSGGSCG